MYMLHVVPCPRCINIMAKEHAYKLLKADLDKAIKQAKRKGPDEDDADGGDNAKDPKGKPTRKRKTAKNKDWLWYGFWNKLPRSFLCASLIWNEQACAIAIGMVFHPYFNSFTLQPVYAKPAASWNPHNYQHFALVWSMKGLVWQSCIRGVRDEHAASLPQERSKLLPRYCAWARLFALIQCNPRPKNATPGPAALPPSAKRNPLKPSALACSLARSMARGAPWLRSLYAYLMVDQPGSLKNKISSCILKILTFNFQVDLAKGALVL